MPKLLKPVDRCWYLGVDPGTKGSASVVDEFGKMLPDADDNILSCRFSKHTWQEVAVWLHGLMSKLEAEYHPVRLKAALERVWCIQKGGRSTMFTFGQNAGFIEGVLTSCQIQYGWPLDKPTPTTWQTALKCKTSGNKSITKAAAHKLWPKYTKQITNENADSLLIAEYLRRSELGLLHKAG